MVDELALLHADGHISDASWTWTSSLTQLFATHCLARRRPRMYVRALVLSVGRDMDGGDPQLSKGFITVCDMFDGVCERSSRVEGSHNYRLRDDTGMAIDRSQGDTRMRSSGFR